MITYKQFRDISSNTDSRERAKNIILKMPTSEREKKIFFCRHGLEDGIVHTLEDTGKMFGVTRERVRQIEGKMFERLGFSELSPDMLVKSLTDNSK